jgi:uncharacterized protein (TIGR02145 family)
MKKHIPALFLFLALFVSSSLVAQSPLGIPYQAVMRNVDGSVMASSAVSLTFMIHDGTANGTVVYQESHSLTSNAQGLVTCVVGNGVVSEGNFNSINWGSGAKFLQVMMGTTDLRSQQLLSVPYALYAGACDIQVSLTGDTLYTGAGNFVIVPGISAANNPTSELFNGSILLPGNNTCNSENICTTGCEGQTTLTYHSRNYDLVEIGGQCWFADNLATDYYSNGDPIISGLGTTDWHNTVEGAYAIYNGSSSNDLTYGKLYNWYTTVDSRGVCPSGWHVPSDCEWMYLERNIGMDSSELEMFNERGIGLGGLLKSTSNWNSPNTGASNGSGFNAVPGGGRFIGGSYGNLGVYCNFWTSTWVNSNLSRSRVLSFDNSSILRVYGSNQQVGFSIRCIRD